MKTAQPIRNKQDLKHFMDYYRCMEAHPRNYLLIVMGVNTALRISDLLRLRWRDVYDEMHDTIRRHIFLVESKTGKASCIFVNAHIREALLAYRKSLCTDGVMTEQREVGGQFLFCGKDEVRFHVCKRTGLFVKQQSNVSCLGRSVRILCEKRLVIMHGSRGYRRYFLWKFIIIPLLQLPSVISVSIRTTGMRFLKTYAYRQKSR